MGKVDGSLGTRCSKLLGFSEGISGEDLLAKGRAQALKFGVTLVQDNIRHLSKQDDLFQ